MTTFDEVDPADEPRAMRNKPRWQRAIVMVAGSFMHFALAFVLLIILALGIGLANSNTTTIGSVASCVPASAKALAQSSCKNSQGSAPAKTAGIKANDKIIAIAGKSPQQLGQSGHGHPRAARGQAGPHHRAAQRQGAAPDRDPGQRPRPPRVLPRRRRGPGVRAGQPAPRGDVRGLRVRPGPGRLGAGGRQAARGPARPVRQGPVEDPGGQREQRGRRRRTSRGRRSRPAADGRSSSRTCC